jgi:hypothetical protein
MEDIINANYASTAEELKRGNTKMQKGMLNMLV